MKNWKPQDVVALTLIVGCILLLAIGRNHLIQYILLSVSSAYGLVKINPTKYLRK